ncbi:DUF2953 domain-containing protein [Kroppenstedtia pulmonis]|uniref:DUF2953 domain-containing protein n=1 Tax=Kroppenstedtia pulmonis TaxID=1380685 RepID=A0A7D3Y1K2_9BACL|nr:DUF2953 domain-containing protein [Kroppenstedtia pulmonis]QKG84283.1 DUF2953 domain-containing protein [Kroppenstedtia pulmonis]
MGWLFLVAGIGVMGVFVLSPVRVFVVYYRRGEDDQLKTQIRLLWGLIRLRYEMSMADLTEKGLQVKEKGVPKSPGKKKRRRKRITLATLQRWARESRYLQERIVHLYDVLRRFFSQVVCERLTWVSDIGTGDAAETGVLTGVVWSVKTTMIGMLGSYIRWGRSPDLDVRPFFEKEILDTNLNCIIRFRVGHAILAVLRLLTRIHGKGSEKNWQSTLYKA